MKSEVIFGDGKIEKAFRIISDKKLKK